MWRSGDLTSSPLLCSSFQVRLRCLIRMLCPIKLPTSSSVLGLKLDPTPQNTKSKSLTFSFILILRISAYCFTTSIGAWIFTNLGRHSTLQWLWWGRACSLVKCVKRRLHASLHISQGELQWKAFKIRNGLPDSWNGLLPQLEMIPQVFIFFRLKARFLKLDHKEGVNVSENDLTYYIISAESHLWYVGCSLVTVVQVGGALKKDAVTLFRFSKLFRCPSISWFQVVSD